MVCSHFLPGQRDRVSLCILGTVELVDVLAGVIVVQDDVLDEGVLIEVHSGLAEDAYFPRRHQLIII